MAERSSILFPAEVGTAATRTINVSVDPRTSILFAVVLANRSGAASFTVVIKWRTPSGASSTLVTSAAMVANGTYLFQVGPYVAASGTTLTGSHVVELPRDLTIELAGGSGGVTYDSTVDVAFISER